ncbi:MAG: undecaprenyl/decaprenyl-phosphate alpha-N-acetylglucosaminyl 1-phosphate transferase [Elusimicrobiaceae bacterium]|nr:undecaprenyl/decaprenyl-phosphate alpha-N-acetylglucosaminyl 1-phosphate transferase [Elusimicrobiaceae bacterium]
MPTFVLYLLCAGISFALTSVALPVLHKLAANAFLDAPGGLKKHAGKVPVLGGCGILAGIVGSLVFIRLTTAFPSGTLHTLRGVIIGGGLIFLMGLADDLKKPKGVSVPVKLFIQAAATAALIYYGVAIHAFTSPWISYPLTFLWVVGLTNAFNLLDIMDGLCVSQAVVCTLGLAVIALPSEYVYVNFAALALLGACLAFWPYNHAKKRKIFLGDSGSNLLGFLIAALSIGTGYCEKSDWGFLAPLFILAVPLFDTAFVTLARLLKGKNPLKGSNDHAALRLKKLGWKPGWILFAFALTGLTANIFAFTLTHCCVQIAASLFMAAGAFGALITLWLLHLKTDL